MSSQITSKIVIHFGGECPEGFLGRIFVVENERLIDDLYKNTGVDSSIDRVFILGYSTKERIAKEIDEIIKETNINNGFPDDRGWSVVK